jgi:amino acid transporter
MAPPHRRPEGLLPWVLDDAARTRRLCLILALVLSGVVLIALSLVVVAFLSPLAGAALSGGLGVFSAPIVAAYHRRRGRRAEP